MENTPPKKKLHLWIDPAKCVGCGKCLRNCPAKAIDAAFIIDNSVCISCGICHRFCWFGAIFERTGDYSNDYHVHHRE